MDTCVYTYHPEAAYIYTYNPKILNTFAHAHLLHEATRHIIEQKWAEGVTLKDIGRLLNSWAPEPYRNKPY